MPVFKSLADFLINLSPQRNREQSQDQRSTVRPTQPPPSTPPPSCPARSGRRPFTLGSPPENNDLTEPITPGNADIAADHKVLDSYVKASFSSPPGSTTTSERLHTRFLNPSPGAFTQLDMSHRNSQPFPAGRQKLMHPSSPRPGESSPMLDKNRQKDSRDRQDEARLLGARYHDSQAVKIKPGATFLSKNKKPGSSFAFSPQDKLSQNARSSGPVRANGEAKKQSSIRRKSPQLDHAFAESPRPSKRRRQSDTSETIDLTAAANRTVNETEQGMQQSPSNRKAHRHHRHPEFRDAENDHKEAQESFLPQLDQFSSGDSRDEKFMENAAQQRRNLSKAADSWFHRVNGKPTQTAEPVNLDNDETRTMKAGRDRPANSSDKFHRNLNGRESPDELQGDITTQPVPKRLHGKQPQPTRQLQPQVQVETPPRKRSPADIRPTDFASPQDKKKPKISRKSPAKRWQSCGFRIGSFAKTCEMRDYAPIYSTKEGLELREDVLGHGNKLSIAFQHFRQIYMGQPPSRKIRIQLLKGSVEAGDQLDLEFWTTSEKTQFQLVLGQANVASITKDMKWMDKAFMKYESQVLQRSKAPKQRPVDEQAEDFDSFEGFPTARRPRLSDSLRDSHGQLGDHPSREIKRVAQNKQNFLGNNLESRNSTIIQKDPLAHSDTDTGADIPVKPLESTDNPPERETRSFMRRAARKAGLSHRDLTPEATANQSFKDDAFRENWKKPLVYPPNGKKKAEVNLEDRDRLRTDDFLNDNLIAFYMRFLQDHLERTNPETAKRVYFFNSYFFATLAKDTRTRGINYAGVEKWTRNVDLFSYDYIVVPINESAHWYVAIICNLPGLSLDSADRIELVQTPTLEKGASNAFENEIHQIQETPEPELEPRPDQGSASEGDNEKNNWQLSMAQTEIETNENPSSVPIEAGGDAGQDIKDTKEQAATGGLTKRQGNPPPPANISKSTAQKLAQEHAAASQSKGTTKKKRTGLKLDPNQTTIVTFDSLDAPRSPTIKLLRDYTCREAASKRGVQLNPNEIKGMRARGIPLQPNFWDCGLYLLAYLERFAQGPDYFIAKVLQRSMRTIDDWPLLGSGLLRDRFGKFLDELYMEQKSACEPIMVDQSPVSFLLGPPPRAQEEAPDIDVVPESQPESDPKADDMTNAVSKIEDHMEYSNADQIQLVPGGQFQDPNEEPSKPSADRKLPDDTISHPKEGPLIQVPDSQEEPKIPGTSSPTKKECK